MIVGSSILNTVRSRTAASLANFNKDHCSLFFPMFGWFLFSSLLSVYNKVCCWQGQQCIRSIFLFLLVFTRFLSVANFFDYIIPILFPCLKTSTVHSNYM